MRALLFTLAVACTTNNPGITGTQSLQIDFAPGTPSAGGAVGGTTGTRLAKTDRTVFIDVTAKDANGKVDTKYDRDVHVRVQFLGTLTPPLPQDGQGMTTPIATFHVTAGQATNQIINLPAVFGPTTIWVDDADDATPNFATGVSQTLWYPDPFITDIRTPIDLTGGNSASFQSSVLDGKNVQISQSRYGATGRLVVTSVFAQGYTLADVNCQDASGTPPCVAAPYDYIDVFSYHAPTDQYQIPGGQPGQRRFVEEGETITAFAGGVSEFDGLCEIGFPQTFVYADAPDIDKAHEPPVYQFDYTKPDATTGPAGLVCAPSETGCVYSAGSWFLFPIHFKQAESAFVEIDGAVVCNLDSDYDQYNQWKLDPTGVGGNCSGNQNVINIVSAGVVPIDPATLVGKKVTKAVGNVRSINIGNFHVWTIYPRNAADLVP
jgi:hypothetical protein